MRKQDKDWISRRMKLTADNHVNGSPIAVKRWVYRQMMELGFKNNEAWRLARGE